MKWKRSVFLGDENINFLEGTHLQTTNEIILVGTFHFEQEGEIIHRKEKQIVDLVKQLAIFSPTKIALEWDDNENKRLNADYSRGFYSQEVHEIHQIGFRLGQHLGHQEVYAIDWEGRLTPSDMESLNQAIEEKHSDILHKRNTYFNESFTKLDDKVHIINSYAALNKSENVKKLEEMYLSFVHVKNGKDEIGLDFLNKWMERELKVFKNILEIAENEHERVLLLIGNDHLWMLKNLFEGKGWRVINPFEIKGKFI